jgi:hypothetical protein
MEARSDSCRPIARQCPPLLYAIDLGGKAIKIGHTTDLAERIRHLANWSDVLAIKPGTRTEEPEIHRRLSPYVSDGRETYHRTPEVLALVNEWRAVYGYGPVTA